MKVKPTNPNRKSLECSIRHFKIILVKSTCLNLQSPLYYAVHFKSSNIS